MAENEKQIIASMADAIAALPDGKKEYFIGFAEGVAAMAAQMKPSDPENVSA